MCTSLPAQKKWKVAPPPWKYLGWNVDPPVLLWHRELDTEGRATNCIWVFRVVSFIVDQRWKWPKFSLILELYSHAMDYLVIKKCNIHGNRDSSGGNTLVLQVRKPEFQSSTHEKASHGCSYLESQPWQKESVSKSLPASLIQTMPF